LVARTGKIDLGSNSIIDAINQQYETTASFATSTSVASATTTASATTDPVYIISFLFVGVYNLPIFSRSDFQIKNTDPDPEFEILFEILRFLNYEIGEGVNESFPS
jgi:hypothetical protein